MKKIGIIIILIALVGILLLKVIKVQDIIYRAIYPKLYYTEVNKYATEYRVDENLVYAIIKAESNFNEHAVSRSNAVGLMQLMYDTATDIAKIVNIELDEEKLLDPDININLGTKYISMLITKYGNIEVALAAYNAGSGNVDNWIANGTINADGSNIENIPFNETNNYVRKILRDYKIYSDFWG
ncbi:MAG: lytic transglycosylase domain-containing protein [Clostridia bacterium]|nr:lytic transglycosylase domain-containing protein [Clostridia bacterium]